MLHNKSPQTKKNKHLLFFLMGLSVGWLGFSWSWLGQAELQEVGWVQICSIELYSPWTSSSPKHGLQTENGRSLEGKETVLAHLSFCLVRAAILLLAK